MHMYNLSACVCVCIYLVLWRCQTKGPLNIQHVLLTISSSFPTIKQYQHPPPIKIFSYEYSLQTVLYVVMWVEIYLNEALHIQYTIQRVATDWVCRIFFSLLLAGTSIITATRGIKTHAKKIPHLRTFFVYIFYEK